VTTRRVKTGFCAAAGRNTRGKPSAGAAAARNRNASSGRTAAAAGGLIMPRTAEIAKSYKTRETARDETEG